MIINKSKIKREKMIILCTSSLELGLKLSSLFIGYIGLSAAIFLIVLIQLQAHNPDCSSCSKELWLKRKLPSLSKNIYICKNKLCKRLKIDRYITK